MIENIFGWGLLFGVPFVIAFGVMYMIRRSMQKTAEVTAARALALEKSRKERDEAIKMQKQRQREEEQARQKLRQHPNYGHPDFNPLNPDVLMVRRPVSSTVIKPRTATVQKQVVSGNSVGIQSNGNVNYNRSSDDGIDLMTIATIGAMLANHSEPARARTDEDTGRVEVREETKSSSWDSDDDRKSSWSSSSDIGSSSSWDSSSSSSSSDW